MKKSTKTTFDSGKGTETGAPAVAYGVKDWRMLRRHLVSKERVKREGDVENYFQTYWPATEAYESALNPIFLLDLPQAAKVSPDRSWLVRDGLVPLLWFFSQNPEPAGFRGRLSIHANFESYVPEAWRKQADLYELFSDGNDSRASKGKFGASPDDELVLTGLATPSVCSINRLKSDLDAIITAAGGAQRLAKMRIRVFLPPRFEMPDYLNGPSYNNVLLQTLFSKVGLGVEFFEFEGFQWMQSSNNIWFHEFNERLLYADSLLSMISLSKGHRPVLAGNRSSSGKFDRILPIYPYVSCGIRTEFRKEYIDYASGNWVTDSQERAKSFYYATSSHASQAYPWPRWFVGWCKDLLSSG